jgi:hypothetical protein
MPGMPVGAVHQNVPLSNLAVLYRPGFYGFIADDVCPILPVVHESDTYYTLDAGRLLRDRRLRPRARQDGAAFTIEFAATTASYQARRRELAWDISDRERSNADDQLRLEMVKQEGVLGRLAMLREMRIEAKLQPNNVTTTVAGESITGGLDSSMTAAKTAFWDGAATFANVATDIAKGITKMRQTIGQKPTHIVIPAAVAEGLQKSAFYSAAAGPLLTITDPATSPAFTSFPLLPPVLFGLKVLIGGEIKNTAVEGQTASYSDVWGETVRILYVNPSPAVERPSVAYTFQSEAPTTRQSRDDRKRLDWFAAGRTIDERVVAAFAGYTISDCLT